MIEKESCSKEYTKQKIMPSKKKKERGMLSALRRRHTSLSCFTIIIVFVSVSGCVRRCVAQLILGFLCFLLLQTCARRSTELGNKSNETATRHSTSSERVRLESNVLHKSGDATQSRCIEHSHDDNKAQGNQKQKYLILKTRVFNGRQGQSQEKGKELCKWESMGNG